MSSHGLEQITNFVAVSDSIGTAGQPTAEQFRDVQLAGYQVVVNLAMSSSPNALPDERELATGLGLDYVHIPVVWERPAADDLDRFFSAMEKAQGRPVFVHCVLNMRVSVFVYLYRVIRQGVPSDAAYAEVGRVWQPNAVWHRFIVDSLVRCGVETTGLARPGR